MVVAGCSQPAIALPPNTPAAATVDGHDISMAAYEARLRVSQARDPFAAEAVPSPASSQRLEDFTVEQLIREEIVRQLATPYGITISDQQLVTREAQLQASAGTSSFRGALTRNGFTAASFHDYERALLTEVALVHRLAKDRIAQAQKELASGESFEAAVAKWNDDSGTSAAKGEAGWLRPGDLPEPSLRAAVDALAVGGLTGIVETERGLVIAKALDRRGDLVRLAVILVLAPTVDLFSPQATPAWFIKLVDDRESALKSQGKIVIRVGSSS